MKTTTDPYEEFISAKLIRAEASGFKCGKLTRRGAKHKLFDWQQFVVTLALATGKYALFEDCGLGKSGQQVIWADEVAKHTGKPVLILCPLAVAEQTVGEGEKFGVKVKHVREPEEVEIGKPGIFITNYDRLEKFAEVIKFIGGVVLDESSLLKSLTGKTRLMLTELFRETEYKLCCTATPAPNDYTELGQHAEFLNVMTSGQMLATWFINDTSDTGTWRLKRHARADFWRWVGSWAACISKPSDIGFSDDGYDLPPLELHNHSIAVDETSGAREGELFRSLSVSAATIQAESRFSLKERCEKAVEIALSENTPCIIWCELNDESAMLAKLLKEAHEQDCYVEVVGSDPALLKESKLNEFTSGEVAFIVTKPEMGGFGLNWQHCTRQVFVGQSWSMERQYQAIRRSYRFGQTKPVHIHFITPSTLGDVRVRVREKFEAHEAMKLEMKEAAKELNKDKETIILPDDMPHLGSGRSDIYNGDCVAVARKHIKDASVGFSIFSPPFADLFTYSSRPEDMGNCKSIDEFMEHFGFQIAELGRVTAPGRLCAVHCSDLLASKWKHGAIELQDFTRIIEEGFRGDADAFLVMLSAQLKNKVKRIFKAQDWLFHCAVTIWKNPVTEMQRTKAHGLLYKTLKKDSSNSRVGSPEYLLVFKRRGDNEKPITHTETDFPLDEWQEHASPVWMDIDQSNVLNRKGSKEQGDERHICPLQLDVIERAIKLWSAPGDLVYSPFTGIGSEGYQAVKMQRRFIGSELKASYFRDAAAWMRQAESERELFTLDGAAMPTSDDAKLLGAALGVPPETVSELV